MENGEATNIHSFPGYAKGRRAPTRRRSLSFTDFLRSVPTVPLVDTAPAFTFPMDGNDRVGDCVIAAWDHARQVITGLLTARQLNFTQDQLWDFYKTQNPKFDPNGSPETNGPGSPADNGMDIQLFLEYLVAHKYILGFAAIDPHNEQEMKAATYLGLAVITGVVLDQAQMQQFVSGTWDYVASSPEDGGHCIPLIGYAAVPDEQTCITWAKPVQCTEAFISHQMDEAWFILMQEHIDHPGFRNHFDLAAFSAAVAQITDNAVNVPTASANFVFTKVLSHGMTNSDVLQLQKRLSIEPAADGSMCYAYQQNGQLYFSDYFGDNTEAAVEKYQIAHGIASSGTPATTGFGQVGPKTIASLNGNAGTVIPLVDAMIMVESSGDDNAIGDSGAGFGCLQVHEPVVDQVNAVLKTAYTAKQTLGNRALSLLIFNTYYAKVHPEFTTDEDKAKCWNGGPGFKEILALPNPTIEQQSYIKNVNAYWTHVQAAMSGPMPPAAISS